MRSNIKAAPPPATNFARRWIALASGWIVLASGCSTGEPPAAEPAPTAAAQPSDASAEQLASLSPARPNVVLISLDTVRADRLGCYGYAKPTTPQLDRLAEDGIRFEQCRTPATWTLPAHMSLFTSLLPAQHGVDNLNKTLPRGVLTAPEALRQSGYHTAALVNNGQMQAHWGFDRGFDIWREFAVDTPAGKARSITDEAIAWLGQKPADRPYFLFLHYYDAHDPYDAAVEYREKFGARLSGEQCRELCFAHRSPEQPEPGEEALRQLQASYDAGLAELDHELGRLLAALGPETLIVVCSDHGEAFREHGWLLHGASLYEEETRVPLIARLPQAARAGTVVSDSTTLLDVAPTLLALAGVPIPQQFQGIDCRPAMLGAALPPRCALAESKAVLEGEYTRSAVLYPYKLIWNIADGGRQLYKLPNEQDNLAEREPRLTETLLRRLEAALDEDSFWLLRASDEDELEVSVTLSAGSFGLFIPLGFDPQRDELAFSSSGNELTWRVAPAASGRVKALLLEPADRQASLRLHVARGGEPAAEAIALGAAGEPVSATPVTLAGDFPARPPREAPAFAAERPGLWALRYQSLNAPARPSQVAPLDAETIRQLRSLGYLK